MFDAALPGFGNCRMSELAVLCVANSFFGQMLAKTEALFGMNQPLNAIAKMKLQFVKTSIKGVYLPNFGGSPGS